MPLISIAMARSGYRGELANHHVRNRRHLAARLFQAAQRSAESTRVGRRTTARRLTAGGLVAWLGAASACATARPESLASRFIVPGSPTVSVDWRVPDASLASRAAAPVAPPPVPRGVSLGTTIESVTPSLQARLDALAANKTASAYLDVAAQYRQLGIADRAFDVLLAGLADHPRHGGLHEAVARQWQAWGFPSEGLRNAHLAVRYAPAAAGAHTVLGTILWDLGRYSQAAEAFAAAARLAPAAAYARHNHCAATSALGRVPPDDCPPIPRLPRRSPPHR